LFNIFGAKCSVIWLIAADMDVARCEIWTSTRKCKDSDFLVIFYMSEKYYYWFSKWACRMIASSTAGLFTDV
jgi:hypothetical protein